MHNWTIFTIHTLNFHVLPRWVNFNNLTVPWQALHNLACSFVFLPVIKKFECFSTWKNLLDKGPKICLVEYRRLERQRSFEDSSNIICYGNAVKK